MKNLGARDPGDQNSFPRPPGTLGHSLHLGPCLSPTPTRGRTLTVAGFPEHCPTQAWLRRPKMKVPGRGELPRGIATPGRQLRQTGM